MSEDSHEEYKEWEKKENNWRSKISKNVKPIWVLIIPALILGGNYLVASGQISRGLFFVVVISFGILFAFLLLRGDTKPKLLPEWLIKQIVYEAFMRKKKEGIEIPFDAEIKVNLLSGAGYEMDFISGTSGIVKREVGVEICRKSYKKYYVVSVHPFDGTILDIIPKPLGINSKDALGKDKQIVPAQFLEK